MQRCATGRRLLAAVLLCWGGAAAGGGAPPGEPWAIGRLECLGETAVPSAAFDGVQVGGLSSLAYDPRLGGYWALSDDRAERGPVRVYRLAVRVAQSGGPSVVVEDHLDLRLRDGAGFGAGRVDPEGIARLPDGSFLVASEGVPRYEIPPFLRIFGADGVEREALRLPARYAPRRDRQEGVRENQGFESAGVTEEGRWAFTAVESSLLQDAEEADTRRPSPIRILRFDLPARRLDAEFVYLVDPLQEAPGDARINVSGVVDVLPFDSEHLLVLERAFATGVGTRVRLYAASLSGADDVSSTPALAGKVEGIRTASKELVLDVGALGLEPDNLEGLAFGPDLSDGRRLLLMLADDNFAYPLQRSQLLAFAVDDARVPVDRIQGARHRSPFEGQWVRDVDAVVTALLESRDGHRGFWVEAPPGQRDADPATSEGLFVEWPDPGSPEVGDRVRLQGVVVEAGRAPGLTVTQLRAATVEVLGSGIELPPPVPLGDDPLPLREDGGGALDPAEDAAGRLESVEGMRVSVPAGRVVGPTQSYGEIAVLPRGAAGFENTAAGGVLLPVRGQAPGPLLLGARLAHAPDVKVGDGLPALTGIVDYGWDKFVIEVLRWPEVEVAPARRPHDGPRRGDDLLVLASFNVQNLDPGDPPAKLERLASEIVDLLGAPDVVALQEVQDESGPSDDGTVSAERTLSLLADAVEAAGGPAYSWRQLDPVDGREGGEPGGNIRVAYLFDPSRVDFPVETLERLGASSVAFEGDPSARWPGARPCLAGTIRFAAETLSLVNCHLKSKQGDDPLYGLHVPAQRPSEAQRLAQADVVARWVERRLAGPPTARIVVLGDLNENEGRPPVERLVEAGLHDLVAEVAREDRSTFNYQGFSQVLDHVMVSPALRDGAEIRIVHANADRPAAERPSDHDPVVVALCVAAACDGETP